MAPIRNWKQAVRFYAPRSLASAVVMTGALAGYRQLDTWRTRKLVIEIQSELNAGLRALPSGKAVEAKERLIHTPEGCSTLFAALQVVQDFARLEWAAESCLVNQVTTPAEY